MRWGRDDGSDSVADEFESKIDTVSYEADVSSDGSGEEDPGGVLNLVDFGDNSGEGFRLISRSARDGLARYFRRRSSSVASLSPLVMEHENDWITSSGSEGAPVVFCTKIVRNAIANQSNPAVLQVFSIWPQLFRFLDLAPYKMPRRF